MKAGGQEFLVPKLQSVSGEHEEKGSSQKTKVTILAKRLGSLMEGGFSS